MRIFFKTLALVCAFMVVTISPTFAQETKGDVSHENKTTAQSIFNFSHYSDYLDQTQYAKKRKDFLAYVIIASDDGVKELVVDKKQSVKDFLKKKDIDADNYRNEKSKTIDDKKTIEHDDIIFLFKVEVSLNFKKINIGIPSVKKNSSDIPQGEKVTIDKGKKGVALRTAISHRDLSSEKTLNSKVNKAAKLPNGDLEKLTIVKPPKPKIILVGTGEEITENDNGIQNTKEIIKDVSINGNLIYPVNGTITSPFGIRVHPITGVKKLHDGTDFGVPCGTPIKAALSGTVESAEMLGGYGNQVEISHSPGFSTSYNHLSKMLVGPNDEVKKGDIVGLVGSTGYSTGCHLHFMTIVNDIPMNPMNIFNKKNRG